VNQSAFHTQKLCSIIFIGIALFISTSLPNIGHLATLFLLVYTVALFLASNKWPIFLLICVPLFNLTPYTGRYGVTEFDSLILITFGSIWFQQQKFTLFKFSIELKLFIALIIFSSISGLIAYSSFPETNEIFLSVYQQPTNMWRVHKALIYALLLFILIQNSGKDKIGLVIRNFSIGAFFSIITLCLIIFWEKGVFYLLFSGTSIFGILQKILWFSVDYRPTALFSSMHVGGGSIDSYIAIMFIFPTLLLFGKSTKIAKGFFIAALITGLYCALATVSRAGIATTALSTLIITLFILFQNARTISTSPLSYTFKILGLFTLMSASLLGSQYQMGTEGALFLSIFTIAGTISSYQINTKRLYFLGGATVFFILLVIESLFDMLEKGVLLNDVIIKGLIVSVLTLINTLFFIYTFKTYDKLKAISLPLIIYLTTATFVTIGFGSASLTTRIYEIGEDTSGRVQHWNNVLSTGNNSVTHILFGNGPGTMPINYPLSFPNNNYFSVTQKNRSYGGITITASHQTLLQRISLKPNETYTLNMFIRTSQPKQSITVALCNRNILIQHLYNSSCNKQNIFIKKENTWKNIVRPISTKNLRAQSFLTKPSILEVTFHEINSPIEIRDLKLLDSNGNNLTKNDNFTQGLDSWFWVSDFEHLGWHSKNVFLHQYFELGILGLFLTLAMFASIIIKALASKKETDNVYKILPYTLFLSFITLGSFITILDDPQIATFWYLGLLLSSLLLTNKSITIPSITSVNPFKYRQALSLPSLNKIKLNKYTAIGLPLAFTILAFLTQFYAQLFYNTSALQLLARVKSTKLKDLRRNHPSASPLWTLIDSVAEEDNRLIFNSKRNLRQNDFWSQPKILSLVGPQKVTKQTVNYIRQIKVNTEKEILSAIRHAKPGDDIIISPGTYTLTTRYYFGVNSPGEKWFPIRLRAERIGSVLINMSSHEGFLVNAPYWHFENLEINGVCKNHSWCEHAFHVVGNAHHLTLKNNIIRNFNSHIKINGHKGIYPDHGKILNNKITNNSIRNTKSPATPIDAVTVSNWITKYNFISDFAKRYSDKTSYAAFFKGGGERNLFSKNLIVCELNHSGGIRIGLSYGGGGTGKKLFRNNNAKYEQENSTMKNNVIANCPNDVGIYNNKGNNIKINNNFLIDTLGIDTRFQESSATVSDNLYSGRIKSRNGSELQQTNNTRHSLSIKKPNDWPIIVEHIENTIKK